MINSNAMALTLKEYLSQVEQQNLRYKQALAQEEGASLVAREADLLTSPHFFLQAKKSFDTKLGTPPMKLYNRLDSDLYSAGITQQFSFGLQTKFYYAFSKTQYEGSTFNPDSYWDLSPNLEMTMPLWANGFGRGVRAKEEVARQQNISDGYASLALSQNLMIEAEVTYWQLSAAQDRVKIQEQALSASKNIFQYVQKQHKKNLGESADVLQARALIEAYRLQLQQSVNEEKRLTRSFNRYLNIESSTAVPKLEAISYEILENLNLPDKRPGDRLDVKASRAQAALAHASSELILERNKPTLDLMAGYALQGRSTEASGAFDKSYKTNHDSGHAALVFQMPLDFSTVAAARAGARILKNSADIRVRQLEYTQDQEWFDLKERLIESKETLKLAREMESAQRSKLENERKRLRQGRTTTFQVLLFEQEFSQSQAARLQSATQIIALESQLKLYQGEN
jgi:outer membrane protein TolC